MKRTIGLLLLMPLLGAGCPGDASPSRPDAGSAATAQGGTATTPAKETTKTAGETSVPETPGTTDPAETATAEPPAKPDYPPQPEGKHIIRYYEMPG